MSGCKSNYQIKIEIASALYNYDTYFTIQVRCILNALEYCPEVRGILNALEYSPSVFIVLTNPNPFPRAPQILSKALLMGLCGYLN